MQEVQLTRKHVIEALKAEEALLTTLYDPIIATAQAEIAKRDL